MRTRRASLTQVLLLLIAGTLVLVGCQPDEEPTGPPIGSTSTSAAPEPTATTPEVEEPPELDRPEPNEAVYTDDHVGAIWAARYFFDLYAYSRTTWDTITFEGMIAPECRFCESVVDGVEEWKLEGEWIEGGEILFDIDEARVALPTPDYPNYVVEILAIEKPFLMHGADGSTTEYESTEYSIQIMLRMVAGKFIVFEVSHEEV